MTTGPYQGEYVLLIACYGDYTDGNLDSLKIAIEENDPDRVVITKIITNNCTMSMVSEAVGKKDRDGVEECINNHKKEYANEIVRQIIGYTESLEIPTEVHLRHGEDISEEIISETKKVDAKKVIIKKSKKGSLMKFIEGSTEDQVCKYLPRERVISLS